MFLTEIVDLSNTYLIKRTKNSKLNIITYNFKTNDDYNFSVDFIYDGNGMWNRHFSTFEKQFDEINSEERFKILNTITKITLDFIEKYKPKKIKIYHVRSRSEFEKNPNDENKRTRVNKYFLEKILPSNYKIKTFGNETEIDLVESKKSLNEIAELNNTYSYEKIIDSDKIKYRFSDGEDIFFVKFSLFSIGKFGEEWEREYYTTSKWMNELNKENSLRILGTVTKITNEFLNDYKPGLITISHIDSRKETMGRFSIDSILGGNKKENKEPNKRAKINRLFLSKNLPQDYKLEYKGNITFIKRKRLNEGLSDKIKSRAPEQEKQREEYIRNIIGNKNIMDLSSKELFKIKNFIHILIINKLKEKFPNLKHDDNFIYITYKGALVTMFISIRKYFILRGHIGLSRFIHEEFNTLGELYNRLEELISQNYKP